MKDFLEVGKITKTIGLKGRVRVVSYIESPEVFESLNDVIIEHKDFSLHRYPVKAVKVTKRSLTLEIEGIEDTEAAGFLVGGRVFVSADRLETLQEGEYYWRDLIGLEVVTVEGEKLGVIEHIFATGSNDVYVCGGGQREVLLPAIDDVIKEIDMERGIMIVDLLEGL